MKNKLNKTIENFTGAKILNMSFLSGGCVSDVYRIDLSNGETLVAKVGDTESSLELEGLMLKYLAQHSDLPVPDVLLANDDLLLLTWVSSTGALNTAAQIHAADLVAALHQIRDNFFGFPYNTVIGGLNQTNLQSESWLDFFAKHLLTILQ